MATRPPAETQHFGELLRRLRVDAGLTQEALAERAGLSARGLSDLERGVHTAPRKDTLQLLVDALALAPEERAALMTAARARPSPGSVEPGVTRFPGAALPIPPDTFVGRLAELAAVTMLLRDPSVRLVTLTGPGGVGKTRLAIQAAAALRADVPGGVAFVSLAAIRDPALVLPTLANALGVREAPGRSVEDGLALVLRERRALVVLDNLEQVLDAAPAIANLLASCPGLQFLITSRVALRLAGEHRYPVPPLSIADGVAASEVNALAASPAVDLFVQRAQQVRPEFALIPENTPVVAAICRRLDGLPLAIELAAARIVVLPLAALQTRLERALPLLQGGTRDQPERLRALREAIAWSYDLLSSAEQCLFRQLAVFEGGFTLEAAEAVAQTDDDVGGTVFDGVATLVEASLLRSEDGPGGEPRFLMLETIREYGLEQLAASDDVAAVREQHAAWVLAFATRTEPELLQAEQQLGVASLEAERPNIRAALAWLEQISDAERAQHLASVLTIFIYMSGHFREGQEWLRRALAIPGDSSPLARASALWGSGVLAWFRGEYDAARAVLEQSLAVSREKDFLLGVARAKHALAITSWMQGDLEQALVLGEEGVAIYRAVAQPQWLAILLPDLGTMALLAGDDEQGRAWSAEGLAINRELGNRWNTANHLSDLGVVAQSRGDLDEAAHHYAESVRLFRDLGDTWYVASPLAGLASIAVVQGYPKVAARLLGVAEALRVASGATVFTSEQERDEQTAAAARAALGDAAYARAVAAGRSMRIEQAVDEAMTIVGDVADDLGTA